MAVRPDEVKPWYASGVDNVKCTRCDKVYVVDEYVHGGLTLQDFINFMNEHECPGDRSSSSYTWREEHPDQTDDW